MSDADHALNSPTNRKPTVKQSMADKKKDIREKGLYKKSQIYYSPLDNSDWAFFGGLALVTALAVISRLYKITEPRHVA